MKKNIITAIAFTAALTAGTAFAGSCPTDMKQIDAAMATSTLDPADMAKVKALRAEGEQLHKAGNHSESVTVLEEAKKMLDI